MRLSETEIVRIADYLGMTTEGFVDRYTRLTDERDCLSLTEKDDGSCIFLHGKNGCLIQPVKPEQCRAFPNGWNFPGFRRHCMAEEETE